MSVGDGVLFYHSNCKEPGIVGIARVSSDAYPDATQFKRDSRFFDPRATQEQPRWFNVDVQLIRKIPLIAIAELRRHPELARMRTLQRGNRLSITPVDPAEWDFIVRKLMK
jgi:predicted RNA-binding protein with PUA-like domain